MPQFPYLYRVIVREDPFFRKNGVAGTVLLSLSLSSIPFSPFSSSPILQFLQPYTRVVLKFIEGNWYKVNRRHL